MQQSVISNLNNFGVRTHLIGKTNWLTLAYRLQLLKSVSGFPEPAALKPEFRLFHIKKKKMYLANIVLRLYFKSIV